MITLQPSAPVNSAIKPKISFAYFTVILIWSTTPLAMVWSSESVSPIMAALLRMLIAAVVGTLILGLFSIALPWKLPAIKSYLAAVVGIYGAMATTYFAIPYINSGLISLIFGLSPMFSGLISHFYLGDRTLTPVRLFALLVALCGLALILADDLLVAGNTYIGLGLMLFAVFLFCVSGLLVKQVSQGIHPMAQTVGALWLSLPFYVLTWALSDGEIPDFDGAGRSVIAILYLGLGGSLLGFVSYFYVLKHLPAATVALVTLITPVLAISFGHFLNDETITDSLIYGAVLIITGLAIYLWGGFWLRKLRSLQKVQPLSNR